MRLEPVNLLGGFNRDDSYAWSVQDVCNWLPTVADQTGTRTQFKLRTPPGLKPYQRIGTGPLRGIHNCEGRLFVVSGQQLYEVSSKGVGIPRGAVPGVGRVRMAHNQVKNGNQLAIANGQAGYIYNTATQAYARITDDGFPGAIDVVFIDGYLFWIEPFGRFWLHSDLADGLSYNTLDRGEAETQPDRIVGDAVSQGEVVVFGERTVDFFYNTGGATGTFQSRGNTCDVGCASLHTIQNLDNSVMWLGNDGVIYRLDGYRAVPISTRAIEIAVAKYDWTNAFAFTWEDDGHKVYYITFPDGETFGYDVVVGMWHRRESLGLSRWRLGGAKRWSRKWIGIDFQNGQLWVMDWLYFLEGDKEFVSSYKSGKLHDSGNKIGVTNLDLRFHTGGEPTVAIPFPGQPTGPSISGNAPDGVNASVYSFAYTISAGSTAVGGAKLIGLLPPGLTLSSAGVISGAPAVPDITEGETRLFAYSVRVTDTNGLWAEVADQITVAGVGQSCGGALDYDGGAGFPTVHEVVLGSETGLSNIKFATAGNPDKFEVWMDGVKVADTGYHGDTSLQSQLDTALAERGLPPEPISQRPGSDANPIAQWNAGNAETLVFSKSTTYPIAEVRVYSPITGTQWRFAVDCPS